MQKEYQKGQKGVKIARQISAPNESIKNAISIMANLA
jgi:hypothetical protein